jgi:hypothetical protein
VPEAREQTAWTCGLTEPASKFSISGRIRGVFELASSDDLADAINDQLARAAARRAAARRAAARRCAACCRVSRLRGTRRFHPGRRLAPTASRRQGIDPRSDRLGLPCCAGTSCTPDISNAASTGPASRRIASGTRDEGRSDRAGLLRRGCHPLAGRSYDGRQQSPARASEIRDRDSNRRADELPSPVACASWSSSLPVPLLGSRGRKRARTPARSTKLGRGHRAGGVTPVEVRHRPRSQNQ